MSVYALQLIQRIRKAVIFDRVFVNIRGESFLVEDTTDDAFPMLGFVLSNSTRVCTMASRLEEVNDHMIYGYDLERDAPFVIYIMAAIADVEDDEDEE